jgi:hypothetical protein
MKVELIENPKNSFQELWVDGKFLKSIDKKKGEPAKDYKKRAEGEYDNYVEKQKQLKKDTTSGKQIRSTEI